ncbi:bifunctional nuclease 2-like isoform X1 [Cucurbita pepo subsp. pepo]|uniref:bifunctional nuclease 2-like isoform X1 n=1 Tax=Cucurbita pepo subsp. pepo TaxID=3664 RepID=UPI000C9DA082|nr:bifunctional nuclease 2-like isoform X1 [Cucurbita pepo subsp. pepo]
MMTPIGIILKLRFSSQRLSITIECGRRGFKRMRVSIRENRVSIPIHLDWGFLDVFEALLCFSRFLAMVTFYCQLSWDAPDLFQFIQDLIVKVGYQVTTARITERVMNTYFARLFLKKDGENETLSVDARPSDALNVAYRCKIPVLVSKQIVYEDAIRVNYGFGRVRERKSCYDVLLDSAADGPDFLSEELDMLKNMKMAIYEERYKDAALWRDKLTKLRKSEHEE